MKNCLRYLMRPVSIQLAALAGIVGIILGGCILTGSSGGLSNFFTTYLGAIPVIIAIYFFISSYSWSTTVLNIALSMGARRKEYFAALQVLFLGLLAFSWLLQLVADQCTLHFGWEAVNSWGYVLASRNTGITAVHLLAVTLGSLLATESIRHPWFGIVLMVAGCIMVSIFLFMTLYISGSQSHNWGVLPWVVPALALVCGLVCDLGLYRVIRKAVVI